MSIEADSISNSPLQSQRPKMAAFFGDEGRIERVYAQGRREKLEELLKQQGYEIYPQVVSRHALDLQINELEKVEVIFSTWGMFPLSEEQLDRLPNLKAVFYAAGTVQGFARPLLNRDITVVSGWAANAVPVAEWTLAQILLANKGYFFNQTEFTAARAQGKASHGRGNFGATVALLGAGQIGRRVIQYLKPFALNVVVFDPFLTAEQANELGVEKVELDEAFARGDVVSNHLANLPATQKMLRGEHFRALPPNATFINTGRGATVAEDELIEVLGERSDVMALLDVTYPEPPQADSPLWEMPNVRLTSHIAGSIGDEVVRMADFIIEEFTAYSQNQPLRYAVSIPMLETMA